MSAFFKRPAFHLPDGVGFSGTALLVVLALSAGGAFALRADRAAGHGHHLKRSAVGTRRSRQRRGGGRRGALPAPRIHAKPARFTDLRWAYFTFSTTVRRARFECSLDGAPFRSCPNHILYGLIEGHRRLGGGARCRSEKTSNRRRKAKAKCPKAAVRRRGRGGTRRRRRPIPRRPKRQEVCRGKGPHKRTCSVAYVVGAGKPLALGTHVFRVRIKTLQGKASKPAVWRWTILTKAELEARRKREGKNRSGGEPTAPAGRGETAVPIVRSQTFSISGSPSGLLYPGGPPLTIPLKIFNPNPIPIVITSLTVSAASSPPGCSAEENLRIVQSNVSPTNPLRVGPGETVVLPAGSVTAPTIQFLDLPVNQDACKNATFPLLYTGSAQG